MRNSAPRSFFAADATTHFKMSQNTYIAPFILIGSPFTGFDPSMKWPATQLLALGSTK